MGGMGAGMNMGGAPGSGKEAEDDDDVPDLVENFDVGDGAEEAKTEGGKLEELN